MQEHDVNEMTMREEPDGTLSVNITTKDGKMFLFRGVQPIGGTVQAPHANGRRTKAPVEHAGR